MPMIILSNNRYFPLSWIMITSMILFQLAACNNKVATGDKGRSIETNNHFTIAFGSCNDQDKNQPLWDDIIAEQPDLWIWLGDNIYGDTSDVMAMEAMYDQQKAVPEYAKLYRSTPVIGTWDDHDYGSNNAGKEWQAKDTHQQALLDFLEVPRDDPRRTRAGVYTSYTIEKDGIEVKVFLLDARYFRDKQKVVQGRHVPSMEGTILGEAQWTWLEDACSASTADIHIFASGIQVIPEDHRFEKWANFPLERNKLMDLVVNAKVKNPIFISGDRHIGEISSYEHDGKPLYEVTSSSLTHGWGKRRAEENKFRKGNIVYDLNYGLIQIRREDPSTCQIAIKGEGRATYESMKVAIR